MRRTVGVLLAAAALLVVPVPAEAGGPTSVLITDPTSGEASALYYTDSSYTELDQLLQSGERVDEPAGTLGGRQYNVTWLIHDVQVWRTDHVYLDAPGGPLIMTTMEDFETGSPGAPTWIRADEGKAIAFLLDNVLEGKAPVTAPASQAPTVVEKLVTETKTVWFALEGWRWALPGLLLGLVAGVLSTRLRPADEPRRVLLDRTPEKVSLS